MSTPTKVFVVLLVVFSIAFTMMTVQYVARSTQWKGQAEGYRQTALAATVHQRNVMAMSNASQEMLQAAVAGLNASLANQEQAVEELQRQLGDVQQQLGDTQQQLSVSSARETIQTNQWMLEKTRADVNKQQKDGLDQDKLDLQQRNTDLTARVSELTTTIALLQNQVLGLQEQNYALRADIDKFQSGQATASAAGTAASASIALVPSDGVEAVQPAVAGAIRGAIAGVEGELAGIDVGSSDGVRPGMHFVISRQHVVDGRAVRDYIGMLTISDVRPSESGGRLDIEEGQVVERGDQVIDEQGLLNGL